MDQPPTLPISPEDIEKAGHSSAEMGVTGLVQSNGYIREEWLRVLDGPRGRKVYREMADNSPSVGAVLLAMKLLIRAIEWRVEVADGIDGAPLGGNAEAAGEDVRAFIEGVLFEDTSHTWADFLTEQLTMLVFGFSWFEIVYKRRVGPEERDPAKRSKFTDGRIGIRKLAPRAQESLHRWIFDDDGGVSAFVQWDNKLGEIIIPIERSLLFRTESIKNNPEGKSLLRNSYTSHYRVKEIEHIEAVGIDRELAGFPVVSVPQAVLTGADAATTAIRNKFQTIARDIKLGVQDGVVMASDMWTDRDGRISTQPLYKLELLKGGGARAIDTTKVLQRYNTLIMTSMLGQFLNLGSQQTGSFSLSRDHRQLFNSSLEAVVDQIIAPINRFLIPRLMRLNGISLDLAPRLSTGKVGETDLELLAEFIAKTAGAGMPWFPDDELQNSLRRSLGLPEQPEDMMADELASLEPKPKPDPPADDELDEVA